MKKLIMIILVVTTSIHVKAAMNCPQISGTYEVLKESVSSSVPEQGYTSTYSTNILFPSQNEKIKFISTKTDLEWGQFYIYGVGMRAYYYITNNSPDAEIFHQYYDEKFDNYFIKSKSRCENGKIIIQQEGSDNDTNAKRVSTYKEVTTVSIKNKITLIDTSREVYLVDGTMVYKGNKQITLKLRRQ